MITSYIFAEVIKSRHTDELVCAYIKCRDIITKHGFKINYHNMDNKRSNRLAAVISVNNISIEYAPLHNHCSNITERMIQTFKAHFISILTETNNEFPDDCWNELLAVVVMQLNMLCPCTIKPEHSAHSFIFGPYDFKKVPLGSKVTRHEGTYDQGLWSDQGIKGFFVGLTHEHYQCYQCFNPSPSGIQINNSIEIFPKCRMPTTSLLG